MKLTGWPAAFVIAVGVVCITILISLGFHYGYDGANLAIGVAIIGVAIGAVSPQLLGRILRAAIREPDADERKPVDDS